MCRTNLKDEKTSFLELFVFYSLVGTLSSAALAGSRSSGGTPDKHPWPKTEVHHLTYTSWQTQPWQYDMALTLLANEKNYFSGCLS